jgi:hypothetical protein
MIYGKANFHEVAEQIPARPWRVERFGFSLATILDANGGIVAEPLNFAIAEYIVRVVNMVGVPLLWRAYRG